MLFAKNALFVGFLAFFAILAGLAGGAAAAPEERIGLALVIDGDTLELNGQPIRLHGIDAPERTQTCLAAGLPWACGRGAAQFLAATVADRLVRCQGTKRDRYGRLLAVCFVDGEDINARMVRHGWAVAYTRYAKDYVAAEGEARDARRGLWQGEFVLPDEWRRGLREVVSGR